MSDVITGMRYIFRGVKLLAQPGIRLYVIVPLFVNTLLFTVVIIYGAELISDLIRHLSQQWSWIEWIGWLLWPLFVIVALTLVFFCFSILANLIAAPFNGLLAAAVEAKISGTRMTDDQGISTLLRELVDGIKAEGIKFIYFLVRAVPLLILFLIPLIQAVAPVIWVVFGAWMIALEYLDFPMANHGKQFPEIRRTLGEHRALALGFGLSTLMMTMIPVVNFIAMPAAVAGATSLWLDHIKDR